MSMKTVTNILILTLTLFLTCHVKSQFNPANILLSIATSSDPSKIDERVAEEIKSAYSSPDVTKIISSTTSSSIKEYFTPNQNGDDSSSLEQWQRINTLFVINITLALDKRISETNPDYASYIAMWGSRMKSALDSFFANPENVSSPSPSSSSPTISLTPIFLAALDVSSSFNPETSPTLSSLTVSNHEDLFQLARMIWVSREIMSLTSGDNPNFISDSGKKLMKSSLQTFQRIEYSINTLTAYQLLDLITEFEFLPIAIGYGTTRETSESPSPSSPSSPSPSPSSPKTFPFTEYVVTGTLPPDATDLEASQAPNTRQVIDISKGLDEKVQSTNEEYGSSIAVFGSSMDNILNQLFDGAEGVTLTYSSSSSSSSSFSVAAAEESSFPEAEETPSPSPSSSTITISLASLDILPSFDPTNSPILSNLTTQFKREFFQLSRMIFVSGKLLTIVNGMSSADPNRGVLNDHLKKFQRLFYTINSLTAYELMDFIPEISVTNVVQAPNVEVTQKRKKRRNLRKI